VTDYAVELDLTDGAGKPGERTFRSRTNRALPRQSGRRRNLRDLVADRIRMATLNGEAIDIANYAPEPAWRSWDSRRTTRSSSMRLQLLHTGEGLHRFVDPVDSAVYLYSQFETADAKRCTPALTSRTSRHHLLLRLTAPADWEVVSNSRPAARAVGPGSAQVIRSPPLRHCRPT